jgi:hypothetical protein
MGQDKHEQEFEEYLKGDSPLSEAYQHASKEQAPEHMDDAILAASRKAVKSRPRYAFSPFASDWHVPLSLAAVLVLSVTVIVTMQEEKDESYLTVPIEYRPQTISETAEDKQSVPEREVAPLQMKDRADKQEDIPQTEADAVFVDAPLKSIAPASIERKMAPMGKSSNFSLEEIVVSPAIESADTMSDRPAPAEPVGRAYAPEPADIPMLREQEQMFKSDEKERQQEIRQEILKQEKAEFAKKRSVASEARRGKSKANVAQDRLEENARIVPLSAVGDLQQTAEDWITLIKQLWTDGDTDEAVQQLQLFYQRYPDYDKHKLENSLEPELIDAAEIIDNE